MLNMNYGEVGPTCGGAMLDEPHGNVEPDAGD